MEGGFAIGADRWRVRPVPPGAPELLDREGRSTLAATDPSTMTVYLSSVLTGETLKRVLAHEICHCAMVSCNLISDVRRMVRPEYWIEAEEWACNLIADYAPLILSKAHDVYERWPYAAK